MSHQIITSNNQTLCSRCGLRNNFSITPCPFSTDILDREKNQVAKEIQHEKNLFVLFAGMIILFLLLLIIIFLYDYYIIFIISFNILNILKL